ncbi:hypothetical protein PGTUg99_009902 [Puccinia graminis f. sp. tritici]|uniref:Uncharacterized protein n=1 Tax=Puccinia graminis f. sp. tritici TaxID=56615 RepID=A0A5B0S4Y1_PUCGR|nr:hypothetical protein PGTUg99_009902 [Puccinia graminis f. sp. tritici]
MPPKSKQSSRQTKSKPKAQARQRTPSPLNESHESSGDDQEMEDQSSDEEAPRSNLDLSVCSWFCDVSRG